MVDFHIRPISHADFKLVNRVMVAEWGAEIVVVHDKIFRPPDLPGFVAIFHDDWIGLITYNLTKNECEIVTLNSWLEKLGVGTALIDVVKRTASEVGCKRIFLITTNNNLHALRFYQNLGFSISAVHLNAISESRKIKPQIPFLDGFGLPIRDEIEMEFSLE